MSLRFRIASLFLPELRQTASSNAATNVPRHQQGVAQWREWSTRRAISEGYKAHPYVYIAIRKLAQNASSVPWMVKRATRQGEEEVDDHPAVETLAQPNPRQTFTKLIESTTGYLNLDGNAYWLKVQVGDRVTLWPLRPDRMYPIPGKNGVAEWEHRIEGSFTRIPAEDVVHFKFIDYANDFIGMSPLQAAGRTADIGREAQDWQKKQLADDARPSGAFVAPEHLNKDSYTRMKAMLRERVGSSGNPRLPLLLEDGLKWQQLSLTPAELDYIETMKMTRVDIVNTFGVNSWIAGIPEQSTFNNMSEARAMFWEDTIIPLLNDLRAELNLHLAPVFDGDIFFDYDTSGSPAASFARQQKVDEAQTYWEMGVPINQLIDELGIGFDPVVGGDTAYVAGNRLPVGEREEARSRETRALNIEREEDKAQFWRTIDRQRQGFIGSVATAVKKEFQAEEDVVLQALRNGQRDMDSTIDGRKDRWERLLTAQWSSVTEHFGRQVAKSLGMDVENDGRSIETRQTFDPDDPEIQRQIDEAVATSVKGITDTTKDEVREEIVQGLENNESIEKIMGRVESKYAEFDRVRSARIARTSVISASNAGSQLAAEQSNVVSEKVWISSRDARVRSQHVDVDGETVPIKSTFSNGLRYPGDFRGAPSQIVNCRCVTSYLTREV